MFRPRMMLLALFFLVIAGVVFLNGAAPLGRLALLLGQPKIAASLMDDPYWKGIALYRLGRFDEAAATFRGVGKTAFFNRGNALAKAGRYPEAVALYSAVLFYDPADHDARANRALVQALIELEGEVVLNGGFIPNDAKAQTDPKGGKAGPIPSDYSWADKIRYYSQFHSGQSVMASREWLESLADEPGRYLKLRIAAEHERRLQHGTAAPPGEDQW